MTEISENDLGDEYWCTSDDVQDEFELSVQGSNPDHQSRIEKATRMVQADWADVTGGQVPDDLPDVTATTNALLRDATAYLAASLAHLKYAQNVQGENDGDERPVFLESKADDAFESWKVVAGQQVDDDQDTSGSGVDAVSGTIAGKDPIHRGDD